MNAALDTTIDTNSAAAEIQDVVETLANTDPKTFWTGVWDGLVHILPKLMMTVGILIIGLILIRWICSLTRKMLAKSKLDPTLHGFTISIISALLYIFLGITALAVLSPTAAASLITLFGVFGLAASLAVKDSLSNLAGGLSVLFTKPFALNDYVKINSTEGTVEEIRLNYTVLRTIDNKIVHIPNGDVAKAEITNFTCRPTRRLDLTFSIGYEDSYEDAKAIILDILQSHPLALHDPEPMVRMAEHGDSAIRIVCRVWVNTPDYWTLHFDLLEEVKRRFDEAGISIPFQQLDVHLHQPQR